LSQQIFGELAANIEPFDLISGAKTIVFEKRP
jgi:hypothetical protein